MRGPNAKLLLGWPFGLMRPLGDAHGIEFFQRKSVLPPLDGSRIALAAMPAVLARPFAKLERFGFLILIGLVFLLPMVGRELGVNLNLFRWLVGTPLARVLPKFEWLAGI